MIELSSSEAPVAIERRGTSVRVVLRRSPAIPDGLVCRGLADALKGVQRDPEARCIVVEGPSECFNFQADGASADGASAAGTARADLAGAITLLRTVPLPTIAVVDGEASGIGASLVLACDLRFATPNSSLVLSSVAMGAPLDIGLTWELGHLLGRARAFDLLYSGRRVAADEAVELGLLTRIVPPHELAAFVDGLAADLEALPRRSLAAVKRSLIRAEEADFDEALEFDVLLADSQALSTESSE